jgi:hypothetical protein
MNWSTLLRLSNDGSQEEMVDVSDAMSHLLALQLGSYTGPEDLRRVAPVFALLCLLVNKGLKDRGTSADEPQLYYNLSEAIYNELEESSKAAVQINENEIRNMVKRILNQLDKKGLH